MTHDRTQPPPDELMGRVVAKWFADEGSYRDFAIGTFNHEPAVVCSRIHDDRSIKFCEDPRTDTDAALELLHWLVLNHAMCIFKDMDRWDICDLDGGTIRPIPISGQPMRTAVCWLAVDVLLGGG